MKTCSKCGEDFPEESFAFHSRRSDGTVRRRNECWRCFDRRPCRVEVRRARERRQRGIRLEGAPPVPADGRCVACGDRPETLCLDHEHATGEPRGWLCHRCNLLLGHARDDAQLLRSLADYLG